MALGFYASSFNKYFLKTNYRESGERGGILFSVSNANTAGREGKNVDF